MCHKDFFIPNHIKKLRKYEEFKSIRVPCRRCLFCRIDKSNWLQDAGNYEWNKYGTASFLTLTYDPTSLIKLKRQRYLEDGEIRYTCRYKDGVEFLDKIKKHIIRKNLNSKTLNKDFKYIMATEYGEEDNLPHIHIIAFGLDFLIAHKLFQDKWEYGFIKCLPLLNGGIRYVTDYIMKEKFGKDAEEAFEKWGLEQPKVKHSKGLGEGLIKENIDFILKNNGQYKGKNGTLRPIPQYYKEKYNINTHKNTKKIINKFKMHGIEINANNIAIWEKKFEEMAYKRNVEKMRANGKGIAEDYKTNQTELERMADDIMAIWTDDGEKVPF